MDHQYKEHPAPTGWLVDGQLVPVPGSLDANVTVWLALPPSPGDPQIWEGLAAYQGTSRDRVELRAVPLLAYDVNYGDEVTVVASGEGCLVATDISKDAGNYTFRVWLEDGDDEVFRDTVRQFGQMGCFIEGYSDRLLGLSCGTDAASAVAAALNAGEQEGRFATKPGVSKRPDMPLVARSCRCADTQLRRGERSLPPPFRSERRGDAVPGPTAG